MNKNLDPFLIKEVDDEKINENVYGTKVRITEAYLKNLPPMPEDIKANAISLGDFIKAHPVSHDKTK